jgi:hypothetical protein
MAFPTVTTREGDIAEIITHTKTRALARIDGAYCILEKWREVGSFHDAEPRLVYSLDRKIGGELGGGGLESALAYFDRGGTILRR